MKKSILINLFVFIFFLLFSFMGCSGSGGSDAPEKKIRASLESSELTEIYDTLAPYPGLESFFKSGNMEVAEFEQMLFGDFLGNDATVEILLGLLDLFPALIDMGTDASAQMFSKQVRMEMRGKGAVPDLMSAMGALTSNIVEVERKKIQPFYDYLDRLIEMENASSDNDVIDYVLDITMKVLDYLVSLDSDTVNLFMHLTIKDYMECKISEDGKLDFADYEELFEKFTGNAPDGVAKLLQGIKGLFYDKEIRTALSEICFRVGDFLGDDATYGVVKDFLEKLNKHYDAETLGKIINSVWNEGPFIGPETEEMGIEGYGKGGSCGIALRELLMDSNVLNRILEALYEFNREGYGMHLVDDHLMKMEQADPFGFDREGEGEFGKGEFYAPNDQFSYKNMSGIKGLIALLNRCNIPFTPTTQLLFQEEGALASKKFIRSLIPSADEITVASILWSEVYEKDSKTYIGNGQPVTEKRGYGRIVDGVFMAPTCPALLTGGSVVLFNTGDALVNGPHDNIYDNMEWVLNKRKFSLVLDLVQFAPKVPALRYVVSPVFSMLGIKELPVTLHTCEGLTSIIYLELGTLLRELPETIAGAASKQGLPEWVVPFIVDTLRTYFLVGYPVEGTDLIYLLPRDIRDLWTLVLSLAYYDSNAFHADRFTDIRNPENYKWNYDIRDYSYEKNKDAANPIFNLVGATTVAMYNAYKDVVDPFPANLKGVDDRQEAARNAFNGLVSPFDYILNLLSGLYEGETEFPFYSFVDKEAMPLVEMAEPLIAMKPKGVVDSILNLVCMLGKPDLLKARNNISEGLAEVMATTENGESTAPETFAAEILECADKAKEDPRRWDMFKLSLGTLEKFLSEDSSFQVVDTLVGLVNHLTRVEVSDRDWALATEGIVEALAKSTEEKVFTRSAIHLTTILDALDTKHIWIDSLNLIHDELASGGLIDYLIQGIEKDPNYTWEEILNDTDRFFKSDLMMEYEEGAFWKDVYYLIDFLVNALE